MVIRKILTYSFLWTAWLVLTAHAMIPHHHHQNLICFSKQHQETPFSCDDHTSHHDHQQDSTHSDDCPPGEFIADSSDLSRNCSDCPVQDSRNADNPQAIPVSSFSGIYSPSFRVTLFISKDLPPISIHDGDASGRRGPPLI